MENMTKALLMAGGVLIALLIIGVLVILFTDIADYNDKVADQNEKAEIAAFNNQYEPYNKEGLTLSELKSVFNKIESNNRRYQGYPNFIIGSNISAVYPGIGMDFRQMPEDDKIKRRFNCVRIDYNRDGRISHMEFVDATP